MTLLRVENLTRRFGGVVAVDEVSFGVETGEIVGLIGPNGAGKTTVINLLTGLLPPSSGQIEFAGQRLDSLAAHQIAAAGVARTYQNIRLFRGLSALDNVIVGTHLRTRAPFAARLAFVPAVRREEAAARESARALLGRVNLGGREAARATSLPYGEQRRLEIARALAAQPKLLLLDEPAAGMNPAEMDVLIQLIRSLRDEGQTILLIEHNMQVVMGVCDRIVVLSFGRKIAEGTPAEISRNKDVITAYLGEEE
ncbi:MAG TPA: ABC transporter ATP-binding protein [Thermomicrobiales bacterium]|jgi:ABC-type branched-subunit amino acid transport system ATPase component